MSHWHHEYAGVTPEWLRVLASTNDDLLCSGDMAEAAITGRSESLLGSELHQQWVEAHTYILGRQALLLDLRSLEKINWDDLRVPSSPNQ